jgi:hypothetical protein
MQSLGTFINNLREKDTKPRKFKTINKAHFKLMVQVSMVLIL